MQALRLFCNILSLTFGYVHVDILIQFQTCEQLTAEKTLQNCWVFLFWALFT